MSPQAFTSWLLWYSKLTGGVDTAAWSISKLPAYVLSKQGMQARFTTNPGPLVDCRCQVTVAQ